MQQVFLSKMALETCQARVQRHLLIARLFILLIRSLSSTKHLWPAKIEKPYIIPLNWAHAMNFNSKRPWSHFKPHSSMDQPMLIISNEIVSPQTLSLITKTRIRDQDAFKGPGSKDAQGIKALSVLFLKLPLSFYPPFCEDNTPCSRQTS